MIHILINHHDGTEWEGNVLPATSLDGIYEAAMEQHPEWSSIVITVANRRRPHEHLSTEA
jgi:hypothetical protein